MFFQHIFFKTEPFFIKILTFLLFQHDQLLDSSLFLGPIRASEFLIKLLLIFDRKTLIFIIINLDEFTIGSQKV